VCKLETSRAEVKFRGRYTERGERLSQDFYVEENATGSYGGARNFHAKPRSRAGPMQIPHILNGQADDGCHLVT
jgi:hypothetical protein